MKLGEVSVHPGDLIIADENGICVVPSNRMEEVLHFSQLFKSIEDKIVEEVQNGADPVTAHENVRYDLMTKAGYEVNQRVRLTAGLTDNKLCQKNQFMFVGSIA